MTTQQQRGTFGQRVKRERDTRGWSQHDLAVRLGVSDSAVGNWEMGRGAREQYVQALEEQFELEPGTLGSILGQAPPPARQSPEDAIEADPSIQTEQKRPLLAHLAEIRRINAEGE